MINQQEQIKMTIKREIKFKKRNKNLITMNSRIILILLITIFSLLSLTKAIEDVELNLSDKQEISSNQQKETITVIAPKYLRPQSDYNVLVNLINSKQPASVDLQLIGARDSNREQTEAKSILIQSDETQTIKFSIGDWQPAEYVLSVQAQAIDRSWNFTQESQLEFKIKTFSCFIQTDKAIYKPGQLVQFRALFLTKTLKPFKLLDGEINVSILDPKKNLIKQWKNLSNYRGLLSLDLQLSKEPILGDYTINVEAKNQLINKKFTVAEYILPTFDVDIKLPNYVTYNESNIIATVKATYTYGKPVNGHVTLTVQPLIRYYRIDTRPLKQSQYRARLESDGSVDINLNVLKDLDEKNDDKLFAREIEFFALVEEDFTGRVYNKTKTIKLFDRNIKIESIDSRTFKPGLKHHLKFKVSYQDDSPVEDNGPEVELKLSSMNKLIEIVKLKPIKGIIQHTIDVPREISISKNDNNNYEYRTPFYINLEAKYRNRIYYLNGISKFQSNSNEYMQISLPQLQTSESRIDSNNRLIIAASKSAAARDLAVNVGDNLKVKVTSTEGMRQVTCQGLSNANIIWALSKDAKNETEFEFEIKIEEKMAPESKILCFYIRTDDKEIINDSISFKVNGLFKNVAKITTSRDEAKPGQEVEVNVLTKPNSFVGLLAIDQSVLLLKTGNDLSKQDLIDDLKSYGSNSIDNFNGNNHDTLSVFDNADLIVITNNNLRKKFAMSFTIYNSYASNSQFDSSSKIQLDSLPLKSTINPPEFNLIKNDQEKQQQIIIRNYFPETWIWENGTANLDGLYKFKSKIPDTITSWFLSAFSLNENFGLALTDNLKPTSIRVFKPFFIKLNLPYSIIRGEVVNIQAMIFNYSKRKIRAKVIIDNNKNDYEFVEAANNIEDEKVLNFNDKNENENQMVEEIKILPEQGQPISFLIRPKRVGLIDIKVIAISDFATDGINEKLLVKPEGKSQFINKAWLINLEKSNDNNDNKLSTITRNISIEVPKNFVPESKKVFVSIVGDLMGPGLSNLDDLLRLPYGCGEQNMINLVPNVIILNYLKNTNRLKENQKLKAIKNIETGYQRQLNFKRSDGSFSAFGDRDKNGSVWLTAYVLKTFQQIKSIITVDEKIIRRAANFIAKNSKSDGSIDEIGMLHNKELSSKKFNNNNGNQQSSPSSAYLTAYSMISLLQSPIKQDDEILSPIGIDEVLEKGLNYLEKQFDDQLLNEINLYDLAIITYTFHLANNRRQIMDKSYEQLWSKAKENPDLGVWWEASPADNNQIEKLKDSSSSSSSSSSSLELEGDFDTINVDKKKSQTTTTIPPLIPNQVNDKQSDHLFTPDSLSIEMTSFALMSTVLRGDLEKALPIVKWLISQQNSNGGFASTQDTVLAIEALALFANSNAASKSPLSIDIELLYPKEVPTTTTTSTSTIRRNNIDQFLISQTNSLVNQQTRLPDNTSWVQIKATGTGSAVVQVSWQYNLLVSAEKPAFYLNPIIDKTSNINYIQLSVCTYYKGPNKQQQQSNMAVMEVELPSGYVADVEALPSLTSIKDVKRVDTSNGDTKVIIYLDKVTRENEICVTIPAHRTIKVSNIRPVPVSIYDYYNRQQVARIFYSPPQTSSCDICDPKDCSELCSNKPKKSDKLISLHEQRKSKEPFKYANLTISPTESDNKTFTNQSTNYANQLLPLAPVFVTLMTAIRNI